MHVHVYGIFQLLLLLLHSKTSFSWDYERIIVMSQNVYVVAVTTTLSFTVKIDKKYHVRCHLANDIKTCD